ncbi:MAG TPA: putative sugar nucleotidyl transferase [Verrucomicrobiae bacterium]|nr:putative sugar nucleotidyl transferase [Verrucomicrobiae bacterium]
MAKYLAVFEDASFGDFFPLTLSRPVWGLRFGIGTLAERIIRAFPEHKPLFFCRPEVAFVGEGMGVVNPDWPKDCEEVVLVNGRTLWPEKLKSFLPSGAGTVKDEDALVAARIAKDWEKLKLSPDDLETKNALSGLPEKKSADMLAVFLWDLVLHNGKGIAEDFAALARGKNNKKMFKEVEADNQAVIKNLEQVYLSPGCKLDTFTVLDASDGPIWLDKGVTVQAFSRIEGPAYIGEQSQLVRSNLRGGCSLGPGCRIGGELESSIVQGWTNKYHSGFIGHAYLGEWINLGAMTTNSDLKNDYGPVKVSRDGKEFSTGQMKVGSFIGDHTKTGIGTLLNTGIQIGFSANLYGGTLFEQKLIPSFSWGKPGRMVPYKVDKAIEVAKAAKGRRGKKLDEREEKLFKQIYEQTKKQREVFLKTV